MLKVEALQASYGQSQVLFDVGFEVNRGEMVTLLGRNGMGKTTTIRAIMGMTPPHGGNVTFEGRALRGLASFRIAKLGLGLVPEGRCMFPSLTVWENITATSAAGPTGKPRWTTEAIVELFPWIAERRNQMGGQLSGGEQQMLAIARALMTNPELLILDEATEGLAPIIRQEIWKVMAKLKASRPVDPDRRQELESPVAPRRSPLRAGARPRTLERRFQGPRFGIRRDPPLRRRLGGLDLASRTMVSFAQAAHSEKLPMGGYHATPCSLRDDAVCVRDRRSDRRRRQARQSHPAQRSDLASRHRDQAWHRPRA